MTAPLDELRATVRATAPAPPAMAAYLEKVRSRAYAVADADVAALKAAGAAEDDIFEQTVAAAVAAGLCRLDAASGLLG